MFGLLALVAQYLIPIAGDAIGSLFSDDGGKVVAKTVTTSVANAAIQTAAKLTGITVTDESTAQQAAAALQGDPSKLADYQRAVNEQAIAAMAEETKRLAIVNETARAEAASGDPYVRRMRPTWGYTMCASWAWIMVVIGAVLWRSPDQLTANMPQIVTLFGIGLAVLGIYVNGRTQEKGAAGLTVPTLGVGKKK